MGKQRDSTESETVLPHDIAAALADALKPVEIAANRRASVRARVVKRARAESQSFVTVRTGDGVWLPLAPRIAYKMLDDDGAMQSFLLRLDAGACLPAHDHAADEVSLVLDGSVRIGDVLCHAGDFHQARAGTRHGDVVTDTGALLYIRTVSGVVR